MFSLRKKPLMSLPLAFKAELFRVVMKFATVGVINTAFSYGVFLLLLQIDLNYLLCSALSYVLAVILSFFLNKSWVFSNKSHIEVSLIIKFLVINLLSLFSSIITIYILHDKLNVIVELSQVGATCVVMLINFVLYKKLFK